MSKGNGQNGFSMIELLVVLGIVSILSALAIPEYRGHTIHAKIVEVMNGMMQVAEAVDHRSQDLGTRGEKFTWPDCPDTAAIQTSLGVGLHGVTRISTAQVAVATGIIRVTLNHIDGSVDGKALSLIPTLTEDGGIQWSWGGTVPARYIPKS